MKSFKLYGTIIWMLCILAGCLDNDQFYNVSTSEAVIIEIPSDKNFVKDQTDTVSLTINFLDGSSPQIAQEINVYKRFNQKGSDSIENRTLIASFTELPATIDLTITDLLDGSSINAENEINGGDQWFFTYEVVTNSGALQVTNGSNAVTYTCISDIGGTFSYVSTSLIDGEGFDCDNIAGEVTWTDLGGGIYETTDLSFGLFESCYGDEPAFDESSRIIDVCGKLSADGEDQYGDAYDYMVVEVDGQNLTLYWYNTYGDEGLVVLTRNDGKDWPLLN